MHAEFWETLKRGVIANIKIVKLCTEILAPEITVENVILLTGQLGTGKTTFAKFLINALGVQNLNIVSPTFPIINQYRTDRFTIWHFDLYRITRVDELYDLGLEEAFTHGVTIIEWPQIATDFIDAYCDKNNIIQCRFDFCKKKSNLRFLAIDR